MTRATTRAWLPLAAGLLCVPILGGSAAQEPAAPDERPVKEIRMVAQNWSWAPAVIRVKRGTKVVIHFESYDASHSFVLKAYKLKVPLPQGRTAEVEFVADEVGEFDWRCGRPCGDGCPKMRGTLIVEE